MRRPLYRSVTVLMVVAGSSMTGADQTGTAAQPAPSKPPVSEIVEFEMMTWVEVKEASLGGQSRPAASRPALMVCG